MSRSSFKCLFISLGRLKRGMNERDGICCGTECSEKHKKHLKHCKSFNLICEVCQLGLNQKKRLKLPRFDICSWDVLIIPEEVKLLHETLLLSLQSLSYSVHFPETGQNDKLSALKVQVSACVFVVFVG